jgi:hypothetical protein
MLYLYSLLLSLAAIAVEPVCQLDLLQIWLVIMLTTGIMALMPVCRKSHLENNGATFSALLYDEGYIKTAQFSHCRAVFEVGLFTNALVWFILMHNHTCFIMCQ